MLKEISLEEGRILEPFFRDAYDCCPEAFVQGIMGRGFTDSAEEPTYGVIQIGDFCFFGGDGSGTLKGNVISILKNLYKNRDIIFVPLSPSWNQQLADSEYFERHIRYATEHLDLKDFDRDALASYVTRTTKDGQTIGETDDCDFIIRPIGEADYAALGNEEWSRDLGSNYSDYAEFKRLGLGFVAVERSTKKMVSGASSFSTSLDSIEIEIDTAPDYRERGLATAVAARMVLECIQRGKYPSWDAANLTSVAIAEKLGYRLLEEYVCYKRKYIRYINRQE